MFIIWGNDNLSKISGKNGEGTLTTSRELTRNGPLGTAKADLSSFSSVFQR